MNKVIFLDLDGVINSTLSKNNITLPIKLKSGKMCHLTYWSVECIPPFLELMEWCRENDIEIIISSTWRYNQTVDVFNNYFDSYFRWENKIPRVVGLTKYYYEDSRGIEIEEAIIDYNIDQYIIIDDCSFDIVEVLGDNNFIKISPETGLTQTDVNNIKKLWDKNYKIQNT